jgi:hypothetical protein
MRRQSAPRPSSQFWKRGALAGEAGFWGRLVWSGKTENFWLRAVAAGAPPRPGAFSAAGFAPDREVWFGSGGACARGLFFVWGPAWREWLRGPVFGFGGWRRAAWVTFRVRWAPLNILAPRAEAPPAAPSPPAPAACACRPAPGAARGLGAFGWPPPGGLFGPRGSQRQFFSLGSFFCRKQLMLADSARRAFRRGGESRPVAGAIGNQICRDYKTSARILQAASSAFNNI